MAATIGQVAVVRNAEFGWDFTLEGAGDISGAAVTANIRRRGSPQKLITGLALTITDASARLVNLSLTADQTADLQGFPDDPTRLIEHVLDVFVELDDSTTTYGPLVFPVRTPA